MTIGDIGALQGADEGLHHQIVDTFATISESDLAWTEKIWCSMASTDGSLQVDFGLGKYQNRGVIDGFGGISRGRQQCTVRASRELESAPEDMSVGPIRYEIIEPLSQVRFQLEANDVQPISFDLVLTGVTQPFFEERNLTRNRRTGRVEVDVIRYHQGGWVSGTVTVDGETHEVRPDEWFGFRDHSWGVRQAIGAPPTDVIPGLTQAPPGYRSQFKWTPMFFQRPDGTYYETAIHAGMYSLGVHQRRRRATGACPQRRAEHQLRHPDALRARRRVATHDGVRRGTRDRSRGVGRVRLLPQDGGLRRLGRPQTRGLAGPLDVDGELIVDCWDDEHLPVLGQLRDTPVRVREGDAVGYGIMESMISGEWPELGLTNESDHRPNYL